VATRKEGRKQGNNQASRRKEPDTTKRPRKASPAAPKGEAIYFIVGIGASAGGLEALQELFQNLPADTGMGFVVVSHLDPTHLSMLPELIGKTTKMPVSEAKNQTSVKPNSIYIIPRNKRMAIVNGKLTLLEAAEPHGIRFPIDFFLKSLADDQGLRAVCIILSGTGTDGTIGLKAVKAGSGLVIAQEPSSARYNGMPTSAIDTGLVDFVLPPSKIAKQLASFATSFKTRPVQVPPEATDRLADLFEKIFRLLRQHTKHDFSQYKRATITRRIERRMTVNQISHIRDYVSLLEQNPAEVEALFKDLLISVTGFFRDRKAFIALKECLTNLISTIPQTAVIRAWVLGCATGEEAYSIAILIKECLHEMGQDNQVQIFATDIDDDAINKARAGYYPANIAADVTQERLERFFVKKEDVYAVKKEIRDAVVFATQDVNKDPPFTKVDLICCRNLLIYLNTVLQARLLSLLHYALNEGGILFLGPSETTGKSAELFITLNSKWKIFKRSKKASMNDVLPFGTYDHLEPLRAEPASTIASQESEKINVTEMVRKKLLREHTPAAVVVDSKNNIIYVHGKINSFLELPVGPINTNILDMARPGTGIRNELSNALHRAFLQGRETSYHDLKVQQEDDIVQVDLKISPLVYAKEKPTLCMVTFQTLTPAKSRATARAAPRQGKRDEQVAELEQELAFTKANLQSTIEKLETSNEELKSTNEELQSTNEELQSSNEELSTSRQELQSINEELLTVNNEFQAKIGELNIARDDLQNFFNSTAIATIFLDTDLRIMRFTPATTTIFNIMNSDIGRPISHITSKIVYDRLERDLQEVLDTLISRSVEVQTQDSLSYSLRISPYHTERGAIQGIVLNIVDITAAKTAAREIASVAVAKSIVNTVREPLLVLDNELRVISANKSFYDMFKVSKEETEGQFIYDLGNKQWNIPQLRQLLEEILPQNTSFNDYKVEHKFPTIGKKIMLLNARQISHSPEQPSMILLAMEDITEKN
jgi:two-component system CheB/CheR fusion protein